MRIGLNRLEEVQISTVALSGRKFQSPTQTDFRLHLVAIVWDNFYSHVDKLHLFAGSGQKIATDGSCVSQVRAERHPLDADPLNFHFFALQVLLSVLGLAEAIAEAYGLMLH